MKDKRTSGNMTEYKEHYQYCREFNPIKGGIYNSVYDLTVDSTLFGLDNGAYTDAYFNIIETIRQKIDDKIKDKKKNIDTKKLQGVFGITPVGTHNNLSKKEEEVNEESDLKISDTDIESLDEKDDSDQLNEK